MESALLFVACVLCRRQIKSSRHHVADLLLLLASLYHFMLFGLQASQSFNTAFFGTTLKSKSALNESRRSESLSAVAAKDRQIIMLFGPPGAGKGSQGPGIAKRLSVVQLSTGDMLRAAVAAKTPVGLEVAEMMRSGALVPDSYVVKIIKDRIVEPDCKNGFVLDGFPRTIEQAHSLDAMLAENQESVSLMLALDTPDSVLEERICGRWVHKESGRSYHVKFKPPRSMSLKCLNETKNMRDDETGDKLVQREDDTKAALKNRLQKYHKMAKPIFDHYTKMGVVKSVNGDQHMTSIAADIHAILSDLLSSGKSSTCSGSSEQSDMQYSMLLGGGETRSVTINVDSWLFQIVIYAGSIALVYLVITSSTSTARADSSGPSSMEKERQLHRSQSEGPSSDGPVVHSNAHSSNTVSGAQGEALLRELEELKAFRALVESSKHFNAMEEEGVTKGGRASSSKSSSSSSSRGSSRHASRSSSRAASPLHAHGRNSRDGAEQPHSPSILSQGFWEPPSAAEKGGGETKEVPKTAQTTASAQKKPLKLVTMFDPPTDGADTSASSCSGSGGGIRVNLPEMSPSSASRRAGVDAAADPSSGNDDDRCASPLTPRRRKERSLTDALAVAAERPAGQILIKCLSHDDLQLCVTELEHANAQDLSLGGEREGGSGVEADAGAGAAAMPGGRFRSSSSGVIGSGIGSSTGSGSGNRSRSGSGSSGGGVYLTIEMDSELRASIVSLKQQLEQKRQDEENQSLKKKAQLQSDNEQVNSFTVSGASGRRLAKELQHILKMQLGGM